MYRRNIFKYFLFLTLILCANTFVLTNLVANAFADEAEDAIEADKMSANELYEHALKLFIGIGDVTRDREQSVVFLRKAMQKGSIRAQSLLAEYYRTRTAFDKAEDYSEAWRLAYETAQQDDPMGNEVLALMLFWGQGVDKDVNRAQEYFKKAFKGSELASKSNESDAIVSDATSSLGFYYEWGYGVEKNEIKALEYYQKAAKQGNAFALYSLGRFYYGGKAVRQNKKSAFPYLVQSATRGNVRAMCLAASMALLEPDECLTEDEETNGLQSFVTAFGAAASIMLLVRKAGLPTPDSPVDASIEGDPLAMTALAEFYDEGIDGVETIAKDQKKAFILRKRAAEMGEVGAMYELAEQYKKGEGVDTNLAKAFEWYKNGAERGDINSMIGLSDCYFAGRGTDVNGSKAFEWASKAVELEPDNKFATSFMGFYYEKGIGVKKNEAMALEWYKKNAELGGQYGKDAVQRLTSEKGSLTSWSESSTRKAGTRQTMKINGVEYAYRWIPAGSFMMGSSRSEQETAEKTFRKSGILNVVEDEAIETLKRLESQHKATLSRGFWMMETEVTQEMWESVMGGNPSHFKGSKRLPVENISWNDCQAFIKKLKSSPDFPKGVEASLPTEVQWEYACRAGTITQFPWGDSYISGMAQISLWESRNDDSRLNKTCEVGKFPANAWGLCDMIGNVIEWQDNWLGYYSSSETIDPVPSKPTTLSLFEVKNEALRATRGGSWYDPAVGCRAAFRYGHKPDDRGDWLDGFLGVRLVIYELN